MKAKQGKRKREQNERQRGERVKITNRKSLKEIDRADKRAKERLQTYKQEKEKRLLAQCVYLSCRVVQCEGNLASIVSLPLYSHYSPLRVMHQ